MMDPIFNMHKIKFTTLDNLKVIKEGTKNVNVYINLENVLKVLCNSPFNNYLVAQKNIKEKKIQLMCNIVNLAAHYKLYFTKYNIDCRVVMYMNNPTDCLFKNSKYIKHYREYSRYKTWGNPIYSKVIKTINEIEEFLTTVITYMDDIYLVTDDSIESSVIPYILNKELFPTMENTQNLIVSNSKYEYQYVSKGFTILEPKGEDSLYITEDTLMDIYKSKSNVKCNETAPIEFIAFIISIIGDRYRSIDKMTGVGLSSVLKLINMALNKLLITKETTSVELLSNIVKEDYRETFIENFKCVDLDSQYNDLSEFDKEMITKQIIDRYDLNTLESINEKFFKMNPLIIVRKRNHYNEDISSSTNMNIFGV